MHNRIINLLGELVKIDSVYPNESLLVNFLSNYLSQIDGCRVETQTVQDNRANIIAIKGSGEKLIAFYAHVDTVPVVDGWTKNPFELTIEDDKAYGLGSYDMKGGMVANIIAFENLVPPKDYKFQLILCIDEENISLGGHHFVENNEIDNIKCIISPEPAFSHGINGITIGRVGRSVFEIELKRKSIHYNFYDPKMDLNLFASKVINEIQKKTYKVNDSSERQFVFVRSIKSEAKGMSVPESVFIELDSSLIPPLTSEKLLTEIDNIISSVGMEFTDDIIYECRLKKRETPFLNPYRVDKNDKFLKLLSDAVSEVTDKPAVSYFRSSVGDDNIFGAKGITLLGIGPEGGNAHSPDEWVSLSSISKLIDIYTKFINSIN